MVNYDRVFKIITIVLLVLILCTLVIVLNTQLNTLGRVSWHDKKIQTEIRDAAFKLDDELRYRIIPIFFTVDNIANKTGAYSWCNLDDTNAVREQLETPDFFNQRAEHWGVDTIGFKLREGFLKATV